MTMAKMGTASTAVRKPKIKREGISPRLKRDQTQARGTVNIARLSPRLLRRQELKRHIYLWWILWRFSVYKRQKREIWPNFPAAQKGVGRFLRRKTTREKAEEGGGFLYLCGE
jgi:hypothetical protein